MKFYDREKEILKLESIKLKADSIAQMTVVMGRRRVGKTELLIRATEPKALYFFVARKAESLLCKDFINEIEDKLDVEMVGEVDSFIKIFDFLMRISMKEKLTLIIDEFQDFNLMNSSIYSEIQKIWDKYHKESKMNLILCGSIFSLMKTIFQNSKEPLFGRATNFINLKPFETKVLKEILSDHNKDWKQEDLLALFVFTGGIVKYIQLLMDNCVYDYDSMLEYVLKEESLFINEGRNLLITEFGREYSVYFSILAAISEGYTRRNEIETLLKREIGGYLSRLEKDFDIITKSQPILSKSRTKQVRYVIKDPFLIFWFRFIYKYSHLIEIGNYEQLLTIVSRDYKVFSGRMLEQYFKVKLSESKKYSRIGGYWDRKGENEIDIVAIDDLNLEIDFFEVKRNPDKIKLKKLGDKVENFLKVHPELKEYTFKIQGLSLLDM